MINDENMKYNEPEILKEVLNYIKTTYDQHYVGKNEIQTIDVWDSINIAEEMCRGTSIKYLMRLGKKEGFNKKDLLKAIHYSVLLMYFLERDQKFNKGS